MHPCRRVTRRRSVQAPTRWHAAETGPLKPRAFFMRGYVRAKAPFMMRREAGACQARTRHAPGTYSGQTPGAHQVHTRYQAHGRHARHTPDTRQTHLAPVWHPSGTSQAHAKRPPDNAATRCDMRGLLRRQVLRHNSFMASRFTPTDSPGSSKPATSNRQASDKQAAISKQHTNKPAASNK